MDTQKESAILYHITNYIGFGTIIKFTQGKVTFYRYIIEDRVLLISIILNGNIAIYNRINQLTKWINCLNEKVLNTKSTIFSLSSTITVLTTIFLPTLTDVWLSGFTDALKIFDFLGTFNINITKWDNAKT